MHDQNGLESGVFYCSNKILVSFGTTIGDLWEIYGRSMGFLLAKQRVNISVYQDHGFKATKYAVMVVVMICAHLHLSH